VAETRLSSGPTSNAKADYMKLFHPSMIRFELHEPDHMHSPAAPGGSDPAVLSRGNGDGADSTGAARDLCASWTEEAIPCVRALMAAATVASGTLLSGAGAMVASADQIHAATANGRRWLIAQPCPDGTVGTHLETIFGRYHLAAIAFEVDPEGAADGYIRALVRQLEHLNADLTRFLDHLEQHRNRH
jgi:hypothetical protein